MPASPSSSAQAARQRFADRLRDLRTSAQISGVRFAALAGWSNSTQVSLIERGQRTITADHVRLWCRITGASAHTTEELLAEQAHVARMWVTNQQLARGGLRRLQEETRDLYADARWMRFYASKGIPGLLQTPAYCEWALRSIRHEFQMELDDVAAAVDARMARKHVLHGPSRFVFVLEQEALWHRTCPREVHREQLDHLLQVVGMPSVSLGIIPWAVERTVAGFGVWPDESFLITGDHLVTVELVSGNLTVTRREEVASYLRAWERFTALAKVGDHAVALIHAALAGLDEYDH
ncbi:helix-turn-helix domain-containing protein [Actinomadura rupiterrae]|uniref:helix-turn-helix domain-containing protein n=1 Tax=Actinomadura rupiterrae TaxID=559627 RepID=UPI0020A4B9E2|nr:helix-turn-helix transcriptional regulator [Actinomadura rupiterrae]MCP2342953.1 transcriptional regulator with XRE-family HTH domain [Actinomadura rupiterrae]